MRHNPQALHPLDAFSHPREIEGLAPEELAGLVVEFVPRVWQQAGFTIAALIDLMYPMSGGWTARRYEVHIAVAEAVQWLVQQGLVMPNPMQHADWLVFTRRGEALKSRVDVEAYTKGRTLPVDLLQPELADKVHHLFVRGDHDTAVFQAFKEVEKAVRAACGYGNDMVGKKLVTKAFSVEDGPLSDRSLVISEREAEVSLFVGAVGHMKNPTSHRDVNHNRVDAAKLIMFASYLLDLVERRRLLS